MTIQGDVKDYATLEPLGAASIVIFDKNGNNTGIGTVAAADGSFVLTSDLLDDSSNRVCFSYVGYVDTRISPASAYGLITLAKKGDLLGTVVITAKRIAKNPNALAVATTIIIAIVLIALIVKYSKVKRWSVGM